jgi:DNA polymerase-3 subunit delta'
LLTADSADSLLPTVVSRCRVLSLRPAEEPVVVRALIDLQGLDPNRAKALARLSGGRIGLAFNQAQDSLAQETRQTSFAQWRALFHQSIAERFAVAQELSADREIASSTLQIWTAFTHDLSLIAISPDEEVSYLDFLPVYRELAAQITPTHARAFLQALRRAEEGMDKNANARLSLEAALLEVPSLNGVR